MPCFSCWLLGGRDYPSGRLALPQLPSEKDCYRKGGRLRDRIIVCSALVDGLALGAAMEVAAGKATVAGMVQIHDRYSS
jgi:hypothetical protein